MKLHKEPGESGCPGAARPKVSPGKTGGTGLAPGVSGKHSPRHHPGRRVVLDWLPVGQGVQVQRGPRHHPDRRVALDWRPVGQGVLVQRGPWHAPPGQTCGAGVAPGG